MDNYTVGLHILGACVSFGLTLAYVMYARKALLIRDLVVTFAFSACLSWLGACICSLIFVIHLIDTNELFDKELWKKKNGKHN